MQEQATPNSTPSAPSPPPMPYPEEVDRMADEHKPMDKPVALLSSAEAILRHPGRVLYEMRNDKGAQVTGWLLCVSIFSLLAYGFTVGMFSFGSQLWAAPLKVAAGAVLSALICLPSLVIFSCLAGTRTTIADITRLMVGVLALTALLLLGFAPVSWIFGQSTESLGFMGALHVAFWSIGTYYGLRFLFDATRFLDGSRSRHLVVWSIIFILVSLQMTTTLRPILGSSEQFLQGEKKFFLTHWGECIGGKYGDEAYPVAKAGMPD